MRYGYVTKRIAPKGYVAVTKPLARKLYQEGHVVIICGNNINSYHINSGWCLGYPVDKSRSEKEFDTLVASYCSYNLPDLGRYAVFYVLETAITYGSDD